jgi:glycosyltransferase involved in cell wall biosynthesis
MIKVSIIVPVYNIENYLEKCLDSLINQTLSDIQIIIINDGSNDNSDNIIKKYNYDNRIKYIKKENGGLSDARNTGLQYVDGEYIGFVDGDDYVDVTMFEKMYTVAKNINADMVGCDYYQVFENDLILKTANIYNLRNLMVTAISSACNKIIKYEILNKSKILFPVHLQYEDVEFFYKLIPHLTQVGYVKEPLYYYVQRLNSICHTYNERVLDIFCVLDNILEYYKEKDLYNKYEKQLEYIYTRELLGGTYFRINKIKDKNIKKIYLYNNYQKLKYNFPNWKKNIYLKNINSLLNIFIKSQNRFTYSLYSKILNLLYH